MLFQKKEVHKNSKPPATNGLSNLDENDDDDVKRIAREMEAKYVRLIESFLVELYM